MILENASTAFLKHNGKYLLLKRSPDKRLAPNMWCGVGGHLEQYELNDPKAACLREVFEEANISEEHIFNLELRYITIRRIDNVIRQHYIYFGETDTDKFVDSHEGKLYWVDENELLDREFTKSFEAVLQFHINNSDMQNRVMVGVAEKDNGKLKMNWSTVENFDT